MQNVKPTQIPPITNTFLSFNRAGVWAIRPSYILPAIIQFPIDGSYNWAIFRQPEILLPPTTSTFPSDSTFVVYMIRSKYIHLCSVLGGWFKYFCYDKPYCTRFSFCPISIHHLSIWTRSLRNIFKAYFYCSLERYQLMPALNSSCLSYLFCSKCKLYHASWNG